VGRTPGCPDRVGDRACLPCHRHTEFLKFLGGRGCVLGW